MTVIYKNLGNSNLKVEQYLPWDYDFWRTDKSK